MPQRPSTAMRLVASVWRAECTTIGRQQWLCQRRCQEKPATAEGREGHHNDDRCVAEGSGHETRLAMKTNDKPWIAAGAVVAVVAAVFLFF
jgi:hypothetical protein